MLICCLARYEPKSLKLKGFSSKDTWGKLINHFKNDEGLFNPCLDAFFQKENIICSN